MSKIDPVHIFITQGGIPMEVEGNSAKWWDEQVDTKFSHLEWPKYSWPGGYEIHYYTVDGGILCHNCANDNLNLTLDGDDQWKIVEADINYEDHHCQCDNCYRQIKPAYGDDDEEA